MKQQNRMIRVYGGSMVDPFYPTPEDMKPEVFIHALCCINRFTGSAIYPYSVGQHTRNLVLLVPQHLKRAAMVHDFSEAWFNDLASPIKAQFANYKEYEKKAEYAIAEAFGVSLAQLEEFDKFDKSIYINERDALFINTDDGLDMGSDRTPLDAPKHLFAEANWRDIRSQLVYYWNNLFVDNRIIAPW